MMIKYNDINCNKKKLNLLKFYSAVFQSKFKENSPFKWNISTFHVYFLYAALYPFRIHSDERLLGISRDASCFEWLL